MAAAEILRTASLRRTALAYVTILLSVVGLAASLVAYLYAHDAATEFLDGQLRQIALNAGQGVTAADAPADADQDPEDQFAVTIWDSDGRLLHASLPSVHIARQDRPGYANAEAGGEKWRVYTAGDSRRIVQVAQRNVVREEIADTAAFGAAAPVLIAIPLAWLVVGWAMNRVLARLNVIANELAERSVGATLPIGLDGIPAEVAPLARSMNSLIARLRDAVEAQRRFVSDAAHELRTPLAGMQIQVENLSRDLRDSPHGSAAALARGVRRASALVNQLLHLARLEESDDAAPDQTVDVNSLVLESVADHAALADRKQVDLEVMTGCQALCRGNPDEIRALISSLIDNAIRYTPPGGRIEVLIEQRDARFVVEVSNTGPLLPSGAETRVFDRFFRASPPGVEGTGLGLAIARRVAERHGFGLTVENRTDASGVVARVTIPAMQESLVQPSHGTLGRRQTPAERRAMATTKRSKDA
jgi:two-component system OmpR family sensor kinase